MRVGSKVHACHVLPRALSGCLTYQNLELKLTANDAICLCFRCKGCWAFLLLFFVVPSVALYPMLGPYVFAAVCGPFYMQRHFVWDAAFATDNDTQTVHDLTPYKVASPFIIDEGPCVLSRHSQNGVDLPCVESPGYPQPYPRETHCSVEYTGALAGSLTAVDFSTSVGDTLSIFWGGLECGNSASLHAPLKGYLLADGVDEFAGMVEGPCHFTCMYRLDRSDQSGAVQIR